YSAGQGNRFAPFRARCTLGTSGAFATSAGGDGETDSVSAARTGKSARASEGASSRYREPANFFRADGFTEGGLRSASPNGNPTRTTAARGACPRVACNADAIRSDGLLFCGVTAPGFARAISSGSSEMEKGQGADLRKVRYRCQPSA